MRLPEWLARLNRRVTNPVQLLWADRLAPWAVVEHVGRRSGRRYRTPVLAFPTDTGFAIVLFYGAGRDWVANLQAAGGGVLIRGRRRHRIVESSVLEGAAASRLLPDAVAALVAVMGRREVLALRVDTP